MSAGSLGLVSDQIILSDPTNWVLTNRKHTGLRSNIFMFDNHRGIYHLSLQYPQKYADRVIRFGSIYIPRQTLIFR